MTGPGTGQRGSALPETGVSGFASALNSRQNWSVIDSASWVAALCVAFGLAPISEQLSRNSAFFSAHGFSALAGLGIISLGVLAGWLASFAVLKACRVLVPLEAWDAVTSALIGGLAWFWAYGILGPRLLDGASVVVPAILSLPFGVLTALLSRRFRVGSALLVIVGLAVSAFLIIQGAQEAAATAGSPVESGANHDVIWVIADELSYPLLIDDQGQVRSQFPHLKELQEQATTYTQALVPANMTDSALPALLLGEGDARHRSSVDDALRSGVFGSLRGAAEVIDTPMALPPASQFECRFGSPVGRAMLLTADLAALAGKATTWWPLQQWLPSTRDKWAYFWSQAPSTGPECIKSAIEQTAGSNGKLVGLWHTLTTHFPWNVDDQGRQMFQTGGWRGVHDSVPTGERRTGAGTKSLRELQKRLYANAARKFDRELGEVIAQLSAQGRYEDSLIVVTADHGVALTLVGDPRLGEDGDGGQSFWAQVAHVPLIVKYPGQSVPMTVDGLRSTTQIPATILKANGVEPGPALEPPLDQSPSDRARVVKLTMGRELVAAYELRPVDSSGVWAADDFDYEDLGQPFAVGVDQGLIGSAIPPGSAQQPATYTAYSAESPWQLLDVTRPSNMCGVAETGIVTDDKGVVVGSVLWEGADATRGWSIVPQSSGYQFWCP
jgi:hypothetical protein